MRESWSVDRELERGQKELERERELERGQRVGAWAESWQI